MNVTLLKSSLVLLQNSFEFFAFEICRYNDACYARVILKLGASHR
ncbi:hypothetical protein S1OALGB6SA_1317 [Olavius algarvensis spirochete endosymbiont]|nr:hypothetical protein S1OALGB6SA_1317 [Olavius algarvensis spirochete endosymbiont]